MVTAANRQTYIARINRVIDHISTHLADQLDLETLAGVAHFSPWHFHRVFQGVKGETLADCVRRMRLEAAARRLLVKPPQAALSIALDIGFASAEVFSRAFRAYFGMTPTAWRRGGWRTWATRNADELSKIHQALRKQDQDGTTRPGDDGDSTKGLAMNVEMKTLPPMRLAYLRHTGPYGHPGISQTWQRFMRWCDEHADDLVNRQTYGISQDNAEVTPADKCRYDCCVEVKSTFQPQGEVGIQNFAGGRYACCSFTGTGATIHQAWISMFGDWLPASGYQAGDAPSLELYEADFAANPETGEFTCWLCVPVKSL
jgi:AraC family transcriptional regulator